MPKAIKSNVDGPEYVRRLARARESVVEEHANTLSDVEDDFDDEDSAFSTKTIDSDDHPDVYGDSARRHGDDDLSISSNEGPKQGPPDDDLAINNGIEATTQGMGDNGPAGPSLVTTTGGGTLPSIPRGRSKAHHLLEGKKLVFFSLDLETGGENCGIIQLSVEIVRGEIRRGGKTAAKDTFATIQRGEAVFHQDSCPAGTLFNEYVKPRDDAEWNMAGAVHGLSATHPSIVAARGISDVWRSFSLFVEKSLSADEEGCVVAYHGAASDMKWIWRLTQSPEAIHDMPAKLRWFLDPLKVIKEYVSCKVNPKKSGLQSLSLGAVWSHLNDGATLEGAHDSLVDARAQSDVLFHPHLASFVD
jgi:hypothetical protein